MSILNKSKFGFTLIELLIVMSIIGVLASLLFANFSGLRERTRDTKRKSDLNQMKNALRLFYNDFQRYPDSDFSDSISYRIKGCGAFSYPSDASSPCSWNTTFSANSIVYMNKLPSDSLTGEYYRYIISNTDTDKFILGAKMENTGDPDIAKSQLQCDVSSFTNRFLVTTSLFSQDDTTGFWYVVCPD